MARFLPSRRSLLIGGGVLGLLVGVGAWRSSHRSSLAGQVDVDGAFLHDWLHVGRDGLVTLRTGQSEMGQGAFTGVATLVAEELGCRLDQMKVETGPASDVFKNIGVGEEALAPNFGLATGPAQGVGGAVFAYVAEMATQQITGGSSTIVDRFERARSVGATARQMLLQAAAKQWSVSPDSCQAAEGEVRHGPSGRKLSFGTLATIAASEAPASPIALKSSKDWILIGKEGVQRVDLPSKVDGTAQYGIDIRRPGMVYAAVAQCPVFGGKPKSVDAKKAKALKGFVDFVILPEAVAAVASSTWRAKEALAALEIVWDTGAYGGLESGKIGQDLVEALKSAKSVEKIGDFDKAYAGAAKTLQSDYTLPYLAHAAMEPMNAVAEVGADAVEVWAPIQAQSVTLAAVASAAGVAADRVTLNTTYLGGGFGRRLEFDFAVQAVLIAKQVRRPVQVLWSREEDIRHDFYRPAAAVRAEAGLDRDGRPVALRFATASQSIFARVFPPLTWIGPDFTQFEGTVGLPYGIPNRRSDLATVTNAIPVGSWRSVGHSITAFAKESFIDEMAHEAGQDTIAYRLSLLSGQPRLTALVKLAAEKAGWGSPLKPGQGRGFALHTSFQTAVAQVVEISVGEKGALKVERVVAAVDCGTVVNPDIVRAQVEGAIIYGLSAALFGKITIRGGQVEQQNFPDYDVVRMAQAPRIEVHLTPSVEPPGGIGEPGLPPLAPALANAIFAATGRRIRSLPFTDHGLTA